ncbi:MAG: PAS domain S-box protein, partial [candidate division Zixibacteria bacterium]|nr:PAS domain S-box protein [candidate division Zixibacteria bacterium]
MSSETATSAIDDPRLFRALLDETNDAIYIIDPETGKFLDANKCAWQCLGCSRTELLNMGVSDIAPDFTSPECLVKYVQELKNHSPITLESVHERKDGTTFPVEVRMSLTELDRKEFLIAIVRDITERQRREQQFQQTVSQYLAMLDTVPAMVYLKDIDHRYVAVNKAFCDTIGKTSGEIIGKTDYGILPRDVAKEYHEADEAVMDGDSRADNHEKQIRNDNGDDMWVCTTKVPMHNSQGLVNGVVGLVQDVSDIHRSRDQLVQSDKLAAIGTLAAGVAHEINNPIGFINSNLNTMQKYLRRIIKHIESLLCNDTLNEEMKDITSDFGEAIEESIEGAGRIRDIVADLKSFSRVDKAGKGNANLNDGIQSTLNIVWNELKYKCKVEKEFGDIPDIYCMANQL